MLFHSFGYLLLFLPLVLLGFHLVHRRLGWQPALGWLVLASLWFYGQWSLAHVLLLAGSILVNFAFVQLMLLGQARERGSGPVLIAAIAANLLFLGYFKYADFVLGNVDQLAGTSFGPLGIALPVGISFYTFVQIGFLVEVHNRQVHAVGLGHYALFACFFPCVTAGPILLQREMLPQFRTPQRPSLDPVRIAVALSLLVIGLGKKLLLADSIAPFADGVFDRVAAGAAVATGAAWIGAIAYTLQLYFDFSGYSDLALAAACLFGLRLPINFNSPLKATSITDFWRRWHITMTRFFTNYLYAPMALSATRLAMRGGLGPGPRFLLTTAAPITLTFVVAGLWHGAGWTFVLFGLLHGLALAVNHAWRELGRRPLGAVPGWCLTMLVVVTGLVLFRAASVPVALGVLASMVGLGPTTAAPSVMVGADPGALRWIALLAAIALACPNSQEILRGHWYSSDPQPAAAAATVAGLPRLGWRPTLGWGLAVGVVIAVTLGSLTNETAFLYYQF